MLRSIACMLVAALCCCPVFCDSDSFTNKAPRAEKGVSTKPKGPRGHKGHRGKHDQKVHPGKPGPKAVAALPTDQLVTPTYGMVRWKFSPDPLNHSIPLILEEGYTIFSNQDYLYNVVTENVTYSNGMFTICADGTYDIDYFIKFFAQIDPMFGLPPPCGFVSFALQVNGTDVDFSLANLSPCWIPEACYHAPNCEAFSTQTCLLSLKTGDVLALRVRDVQANAAFMNPYGQALPTPEPSPEEVIAYLSIQKIAGT